MRRFRQHLFILPGDDEAYESLMQDIKVDHPDTFELLSENGAWTKEGERLVHITYLEKTDEGDERF